MKTDRIGRLILDTLCLRPARFDGVLNEASLLKRVCEHGLAGLLAEAVGRLGDRVTPALGRLLPELRAHAAAQEAGVRARIQVAQEVSAALSDAGIPAVWVKGVALSTAHYGKPGLRPFGDLDLLVSPGSLPEATRVLEGLAFHPEAGGDTKAVSFARAGPAGTCAIDLHWDFVERDGPQGAVRIPVGEVIARRRPVNGLPVPAAEDHLFLAAANLVRSRVDRMILLADFERLAAAGPDWTVVRDRAEECGLRTSLWLGLFLAAELFGAAVPETVLGSLAPSGMRRRLLQSLLSGSSLWARRKVRARALAFALPFLCADSASDAVDSLVRSRGRVWRRLEV